MMNERMLDDVADLQEKMDAQNSKAYPPPEPGYRRYPSGAAFDLFRMEADREETNRTAEYRNWIKAHCRREEAQSKSIAESLKRIADHVAPAKDVDPDNHYPGIRQESDG